MLEHRPDGDFTVEVVIDVNLPSRARAAGQTDEGVKAQERVEFHFGPQWPMKAPFIGLRPTFPGHLAHVNHHKRGDLVPPCIVVNGDTDELLHAQGLDGLVDQLAHWLAQAAAGHLASNYGQSWESARRVRSDEAICFDADAWVQSLPTDGTALVASASYRLAKGTGAFHAVPLSQPAKPYTQKLAKDASIGETAIIGARAAFVDGKPPIDDKYSPDTTTTLGELLAKADALGISPSAIEDALAGYIEQSLATSTEPGAARGAGFNVGVVLAVERPAPVAAVHGGSTELLPYIVRVDRAPPSGPLPSSTPVVPAAHRQPPSAKLLATTAGYEPQATAQRVIFLGCGSLGSKVASHFARAGFGRLTLIDDAWLGAHNAGRHALFSTRGRKAEALAEAFKAIGHSSPTVADLDARKLLLDSPSSFRAVVADDAALLVDTTASSSVLSALVCSRGLNESRARVVRSVLYAHGSVAVVMLESEGRRVRVDDLVSALFVQAGRDSRLRDALDSGNRMLTPVFIGQNCQSLTMPMPDSVVSRGAALVSMQLEKWLLEGMPDSGVLSLGVVNDDRIGMDWTTMSLTSTVSIPCEAWEVRVLGAVADRISVEAERYERLETGGVLLGSVSFETKTILIADAIEAPADSRRAASRFVLGTQGLVDAVRQANERSLSYLGFVGTWHSHPMGGGHSALDLRTLGELALQCRGAPSVSLVWTPSGLQAQVAQGTLLPV